MTYQEMAAALDGCVYGSEVTPETANVAKNNGLVIVYGASDDLMEFRGAIDDEVGAWGCRTVYVDRDGIVDMPPCCEVAPEECRFFMAARQNAQRIDSIWEAPDSSFSWTYKTDIPHADFRVFEDNEPWCKGIVFDINNLK